MTRNKLNVLSALRNYGISDAIEIPELAKQANVTTHAAACIAAQLSRTRHVGYIVDNNITTYYSTKTEGLRRIHT